MAKTNKDARPEPRLPKGLRDIEAAALRQQQELLGKIRAVYERYGFEPLETPAFEYTDALGKFLPDQDRPNEGVFSFQEAAPETREPSGAEPWLSLRYDLTAPLARYVAQNYQTLPKPFRRYAVGNVWRNEKPGPGRYRQFMQFDADTVGAESIAADAEMCMLAADTLEALGIKRGDYVIKVNNRKLLDGVLWSLGLDYTDAARHAAIFRALDKFDRLGMEAVKLLLGKGRKDESGDFTPGAELTPRQIESVTIFMLSWDDIRTNTIKHLDGFFSGDNEIGRQGLEELRTIDTLLAKAGYEHDRVVFDGTVVRGLDYYTGPVFETDLTAAILDDEGRPVRFGSVGSGGRYDDLVARFTGQKVPATGFSIGVSRLQAALSALGRSKSSQTDGPVVVTVMEKDRIADYQKLVQTLRAANIRAELYLGNPKKFGKQLEYADKRGSPCVVIQGPDERAKGEVTLKDLVEGAKLAEKISDQKEWREGRPAQVSVKEADLVPAVRKILARHSR